ncbi:MAG: YbjN domain-containing protein [Solirubrobacteraceae bacterium]
MKTSQVIEQVHGILARERITFTVGDDACGFHVPVPQGSAAVDIDFDTLGRGQSVVRLRAHVLEQVDVRPENRLEILEHLNALNQSALFGRFYLDADRTTIMLEHELLADDLDASELMNALFTVGLVADQTDDELQRSLGTGRRRFEIPPSAYGDDMARWERPRDDRPDPPGPG